LQDIQKKSNDRKLMNSKVWMDLKRVWKNNFKIIHSIKKNYKILNKQNILFSFLNVLKINYLSQN